MPTRASRPYDPFSSLQTRRVAEAFSVSHTRIHRASLDADSPRTRSRSPPRPRARFLKTNTRESTPRVPSPPPHRRPPPPIARSIPSHPIPSHPPFPLLPRLETPRSRRTARETSSPRSTTKTTRAPPSTVLATRASTPSLRTRSRAPPPRRSPSSSSSSPRARVSAAVESRRVAVSNRARQTLNPTTATVLCTSYARTHTGMRVVSLCTKTPGKTRAKRRARRRNDAARESATRGRSIDARRTREGVEANAREVRAADSRAFGFVWVRSRRVVERDSRENCERCAGRDDGDGAFAVV